MNKLLAAHTRFCKKAVVVAVSLACGLNVAKGTEVILTDEDHQMLERSRQIMNGAESVPGIDDEWMRKAMENAARGRPQAQALMDELRSKNPMISHAKSFNPSEEGAKVEYNNLVFVSYSMGDAGLRQALQMASGREDTALVMRGIPDGMDIMRGMLRIQQLASEMKPLPTILLDPSLFTKYEITAVPTIITFETQHIPQALHSAANEAASAVLPPGNDMSKIELPDVVQRVEVARVQGLYDPAWLQREMASGETGDQGIRGPINEIEERDLIEVMKERVLEIDWAERRDAAQRNYWVNQRYLSLPSAPEDRIRRIDASVVATADILTSTGEFVARAGERVNPLDTRPFTQAIVVFDPTDSQQMETLAERLPKVAQEPGVVKLVYIATGIDKKKGWDAYTELTNKFQAPVYLLTPDVRSRFELHYTPSIITADKTHFVVREWKTTEEDHEAED